MDIAQEYIGDVIVLKPDERLDVASGPMLQELVEKIFDGGERSVLIDLSDVNYVSSIGLSGCLKSAQLAQAMGGRVVLAGLRGMVREVFEVAGLDRVLDIYPSREWALTSFRWVQPHPRPASTAAYQRYTPTLSLAEEVLLLALRDEGGRFVELPDHALDFALAGAVLMDLCMRRRVDSDLQQLTVVDQIPVGDDILDRVLEAMARSSHRDWGAERWIQALAQEGAGIRQRVVERLVRRGILHRKDKLLHWMLGGRRYPILDHREPREVKSRVLGVLVHNEIPTPRDVAIIALADACAVFDAILSLDEMMDLRPRIAEVGKLDLLAQSMTRALGNMQSWGKWEGPPAGLFGHAAQAAE